MSRIMRGVRSFSTAASALLADASADATRSARQPLAFQIFRDVPELRQLRRQIIRNDRTLGFVPTMGALHEGHLALIREAAKENTDVFVSIYVNPTQFGVNEDLSSYPRTWDSDMAKLEKLNEELETSSAGTGRITAIFAPTSKVMYPTLPPSSEIDGHGSFVTITPLARKLEGVSRPVFFRGVATVCMKLFNATSPDRVYFGQKDVQQTVIIKRMVKDFLMDTEVRIVPTARECDGLALSSRNVYLGSRRRNIGLTLYKALTAGANAYQAGKSSRDDILGAARSLAECVLAEQCTLAPNLRALYEVDYISLADPESLEELDCVDPKRGAVLSTAFKMAPLEETNPGEDCGLGDGKVPVRLIDNFILQPRE
ncbi:Pantothenate synthetase [Penicillium diatomitis]|uniref:Pantoate--beta-alanine ligase n=1 Tax=Penicillium diatomitis TaxID=2819901 RepID=A0A9W9XCG5_9EURO|nr:Pantothenate synthetase [Penicillium diatomitis]KAJ5488850.1 Pantothenate synthetase [Penicillium diatomitis]